MRTIFLLTSLVSHLFLPGFGLAQPADSVVVTGQIRHLSARLYRESPTVMVSRNNVLQASRELVRPAPLNIDGTFRVVLPLIYSQEELYFNYGRLSTAFLASPGTLSIDLDADSLFTATVPFRFGGVNAQVNNQFARYKAFENDFSGKTDSKTLSRRVEDKSAGETYRIVLDVYQAAFRQFSLRQTPFPLVSRWVQSINRYNAAAFVYDKAVAMGETLPVSLRDSLRPPNDQLLTAARASAMNQFAGYANQRMATPEGTGAGAGLTVRTLSSLLLRYGRNLTQTEQTRLRTYVANDNTAQASDLRFFQTLIRRSNDTIQRLVAYENLIRRSGDEFNGESESVSYLNAYWLATSLPTLTLDFAKLLYSYARPQLTNVQLASSLDELYRLEVKDSSRVRKAVKTLQKMPGELSNAEISPGVFVNRNGSANGSALFDRLVTANRGKIIYVLLTSPSSDGERQAALDAQQLRRMYTSRDFALIYLPVLNDDADATLWAEFSTKNNLAGDHLLLTNAQLSAVAQRLRPDSGLAATIINRVGKIVKRNAPLPGAFAEVRKVIELNF